MSLPLYELFCPSPLLTLLATLLSSSSSIPLLRTIVSVTHSSFPLADFCSSACSSLWPVKIDKPSFPAKVTDITGTMLQWTDGTPVTKTTTTTVFTSVSRAKYLFGTRYSASDLHLRDYRGRKWPVRTRSTALATGNSRKICWNSWFLGELEFRDFSRRRLCIWRLEISRRLIRG